MPYAVKAEDKTGAVITIRSGFRTLDQAEDYPVVMKLYRRVWSEELPEKNPVHKISRRPTGILPWTWGDKTHNAYLVDAAGQKVLMLFGNKAEKVRSGNAILDFVNKNSSALITMGFQKAL